MTLSSTPVAAKPSTRTLWLGAALLVLGVLVLYGQTLRFSFVAFDDGDYIHDNPWVWPGLSVEGLRWSLTAFHSGNWHPLTWISHMLDCQLYGDWAGGHHLTSLLLHAVSSLVLYGWLTRLTGCPGRAWVVAALFAWHPLRAESVAWVSERKDVLAMLLGLLTLWAYTETVRRPSAARALGVVVLFALGLSAKPLLVTLPCVMLLLDFWPLDRLGLLAGGKPSGVDRRQAAWLVLEKLPLALLVVVSSIITVRAQASASAVSSLETYPLASRLGYATMAYAEYLKKMLLPRGLEFIYPHREGPLPIATVTLSAGVLVGITALSLWQWRRRPYLVVGWFWFLGTLVPNIGLVQVGAQFMADRFTYLSGIGLAWAAVWLAADRLATVRLPRRAVQVGIAVLLVALGMVAWRQIGTWRDSYTLVAQALAVEPTNYVAHRILGSVLAEAGRYDEAIEHYRQASPRKDRLPADALTLLAEAYWQTGRSAEAIEAARQAVAARPDVAETHRSLGKLIGVTGSWSQGLSHLRRAVEVDPNFALAQADLAVGLAETGQLDEALQCARRAVALRPGSSQLLTNLGAILLRERQLDEALTVCQQAVDLEPRRPEAQYNLGLVLAFRQEWRGAGEHLEQALALNPANASAEYDLGRVRAAEGRPEAAVAHLRRALELRPGWSEPGNYLAWLYATTEAPWANAAEAVTLAEAAARQTERKIPELLDTLAASYAAAGRYEEAVATAREAVSLARSQQSKKLAEDIAARQALYERGRPFRDR